MPANPQPNWQWLVAAWKPHANQPHAWKLHCVDFGSYIYQSILTGHKLDRSKALCGMRPRYGWGGDLFIDECCERCAVKAIAMGLPPPKSADGKPTIWAT